MKKLNLTLLALVTIVMVNAQKPVFPDGDFENCWVQYTVQEGSKAGQKYWDFKEESFISTLNQLYELDGAQGIAPLTAFREEDAYEGNYSLKLVSDTMVFGNQRIFLPGVVGTLLIDFIGIECALGTPFNGKPVSLSGYMKYLPVNGDSAAIEVVLMSNAHGGVVVGSGKQVFNSAINAYSEFSVDINYTGQYEPDSIIVLAAASADYDFTNIDSLMKCNGQKGSTLYLDNLTFNYGNNVKECLMSEINMVVMPNPAVDQISISMSEEIKGQVMIYDINGKCVANTAINGNKMNIDASAYAAGTYIVNIVSNNQVVASSRFIKQ